MDKEKRVPYCRLANSLNASVQINSPLHISSGAAWRGFGAATQLYLAWLLFACLLACSDASAQIPAADSLRYLLRVAPRMDTLRVRRLQALAGELMTRYPLRATDFGQQSLALARHLKDAIGEGQALLRLGTLCRRQANYARAQYFNRQAQQVFRHQNDRVGLAQSYLQTSLIELVQGNPSPALRAALQGLHLAEQAGSFRVQAQIRATIGNIYIQMGDHQNALAMLRTVLETGFQHNDQRVVAMALNLLGNAYRMQKKWTLARTYYLRAARLNRHLSDAENEAINETNMAVLYEEQGDHAQALTHGFRARTLAYTHHDDYNLPATELALARIYLATQQPDSAIALAENGLRRSQQRRNNENIRNASDLLAQAYAVRGDWSRAYRYHVLYVAYKDTLSGEDTQRKTSAMRYGYELDKKQTQIALLTKTRQLQLQKSARQRLQLYELLAGLAGLLLLAGLLWRNVILKQRTNRQLNDHNTQIGAQRDDLNRTLWELRATQAQLVQREKMASLGELTAGIAHEIQNPLNFVTNFSELGVELVAELKDELTRAAPLGAGQPAVSQLLLDLAQNQSKIWEHGRRADRIVKSMLEHSRASGGQRQATSLNALADESLRLAHHAWQTKHPDFLVAFTKDFDPALPAVLAVPQDLSRVLLNLLANAFYALTEKSRFAGPSFRPEVRVFTGCTSQAVWLRVRDNGTGIPAAIIGKVFQPFFTTKPTGDGTGLGLSLSYDIITKGQGGTLTIESEAGEFTEVTLSLPLVPVGQ